MTASTSRPGTCSQPLDYCGRHLLQCVCGGSLKARHDRIARAALALIAPHGTTGLCAHRYRYLPVTVSDRSTTSSCAMPWRQCILAAAPELRPNPNSVANPDDHTRSGSPRHDRARLLQRCTVTVTAGAAAAAQLSLSLRIDQMQR